MSATQPTTAELVSRNLANLESRLDETTPSADKAFNKVLAVTEALAQKPEYAYAADLILANYVLSAQGDDLDAINENGSYDTPRNAAKACKLTASLTADDGAVLAVNTVFVGPQGLLYDSQAAATAPSSGTSGAGLVLSLSCEDSGTAGTLAVGDELTIQSPVSGVGRTATVTAVAQAGTAEEEDDDYRIRLLDVIRAEPGGGNSADFRIWGESVSGVARVYPFSGVPYDSSDTEYPGCRTVYVQATEDYSSTRVADSSLVALVKAALLADPDTGADRQILGLTQDTLFVQSIALKPIYILVTGLEVTTGTVAAAQSAISSAITTYLKKFHPYVQGLDATFERMDTITASLLAVEIQSVIKSYGGTVQNVQFGTVSGTYLGKYELKDGEIPAVGAVTFQAAS